MGVPPARHVLAEDLNAISVPTLLVWSTADPIAGMDVGHWTRDNIPDCGFLLMENSGHWPQFEEAEKFNREHIRFLRRRQGVTVMLRSIEEKVDPQHAAVVVVDVQTTSAPTTALWLGSAAQWPWSRRWCPCSRLYSADARRRSAVIFVQYGHTSATESEVHLEQRMRGRSDMVICRKGTWGADFYGVAPEPGETVVQKHRYSGFIGTDLDLILRSTGRRVLVMTGIATNGCVEATARTVSCTTTTSCSSTTAAVASRRSCTRPPSRTSGTRTGS